MDTPEIKTAIDFLTESFKTSGHNPKPVVAHSVRVATYLHEHAYGQNFVIVALLHDLIEDTAVTLDDLEKAFGRTTAEAVGVLTVAGSIQDYKTRSKDEIDRAINAGKTTAIVKAADILDNSHFYHLAGNELHPLLIEKMKYFIDNSKPLLENEIVWLDLGKRYLEITQPHSNPNKKGPPSTCP